MESLYKVKFVSTVGDEKEGASRNSVKKITPAPYSTTDDFYDIDPFIIIFLI